jgi:hypothetical protein
MSRLQRYVDASVDRALGAIRDAEEGERRQTLNREAYALGSLIPHGVQRESLEDLLVSAAESTGLPLSEARGTVRRALDDGARTPRQLPPGVSRGQVQTIGEAHPHPRRHPLSVDPPDDLRPLLRSVWDGMRDRPLPDQAVSYLTDRSLCPDVAFDAGFRVPTRDALASVYREHGLDLCLSTGLLRRTRHGGIVPAWRMREDPVPRIWVPVWSPVWPDAPVAYRWRATWPARVKSIGMPCLRHPWRDWPLGVRVPGRPRQEIGPVVICEGEPDWLALTSALEPLGAWVLGMPGTVDWREHWQGLLRRAPALILAMHDDGAGRRSTDKIREAHRRTRSRAPRALIRPPGAGDWNDALISHGSLGSSQIADAVRRAQDMTSGHRDTEMKR